MRSFGLSGPSVLGWQQGGAAGDHCDAAGNRVTHGNADTNSRARHPDPNAYADRGYDFPDGAASSTYVRSGIYSHWTPDQ